MKISASSAHLIGYIIYLGIIRISKRKVQEISESVSISLIEFLVPTLSHSINPIHSVRTYCLFDLELHWKGNIDCFSHNALMLVSKLLHRSKAATGWTTYNFSDVMNKIMLAYCATQLPEQWTFSVSLPIYISSAMDALRFVYIKVCVIHSILYIVLHV